MTGADLVEWARQQNRLVRWGGAFMLFALALDARELLNGYLNGLPAITFLPAIIGATLLFGIAPGIFVTVLSAFFGTVLFLPEVFTGGPGFGRSAVLLAIYLLVALLELWIIAALVGAVATNRRLAQREKTLFLELQHRVANTLQFVAGMLTLARQTATTPEEADRVLEQSATRITAMGQLHRRMYEAANDDRGFVPLLRDILEEVFHDQDVAVEIEADVGHVPLNQLTPLVLLITEAATNSAKHVFRRGIGRRFMVSLTAEREAMRLIVRDDGPGLPTPAQPRSGLGLRIMNGLASQLGGALETRSDAGAVVTVLFPRE